MRQKFLMLISGFSLVCLFNSTVFPQSPYKLQWPKEGFIFGSGFLTGISGLYIRQNISALSAEEINALSREDVNSFDRPATYNYSESANVTSDVVVLVCSALPATLFLSKKVQQDVYTLGAMYLESLLFANTVPLITKVGVKRIRPFVYNPDAPFDKKNTAEARLSFFSGHTTNAFAGAVFFSVVYGDYFPDSKWKPYVWGGSLLLASYVGYLRVEAGKHFTTDVIAGALVGSAVGYIIPLLHRQRGNSGLSVMPVYQNRGLAVSLHYSFK